MSGTIATSGPQEWRIFGPPGTGKTTALSERIRSTVKKFGPESVIVMSFTRTAAVELVGRDLPIADERVGTLHSFAFRALGAPKLVAAPKQIREWNHWAPTTLQVDESVMGFGDGDDPYDSPGRRSYSGTPLLMAYDLARSRRWPRRRWDKGVVFFAEKWEQWKTEAGYLDFTDLIAKALETCPDPPVSASVLYADEVQDFSPLELALVRQWGARMRFFVLAGDDDQTIYSFRGAVPDSFLTPIPSDRRIVLPVSYRLPPRIKEFADEWIKGVSRREPKEWAAREGDELGSVEFEGITYRERYAMAERLSRAVREHPGESVMVLASCGYMLDQIVKELRVRGEPHHNPYRESVYKWNPINASFRRFADYFVPDARVHPSPHSHTWGSAWSWIEHLDSRRCGMKRGAKKLCESRASDPDWREKAITLAQWQEDIGFLPPSRGDFEWLASNIRDRVREKYSFMFQLCRAKGAAEIFKEPKIIVGTIHSVKGGEADTVYLFPDLSEAGMVEWQGEVEQRDSVMRLFYVGMTRARKRLKLCASSDAERFVSWR